MQKNSTKTNQININSIHEFQIGHCGYCDNKKSTSEKAWFTSGFACDKMSLEVYQSLIDKGWRRCGTYYYKPDVDKCCCRPYSIRLNVLNYSMRASHKKAMKKFNKFLNPEQTEKIIPKKQEKNEEKKNEIEEENLEEKEFLEFLEECFKKQFIEFISNNSNNLKKLLSVQSQNKDFLVSPEMLNNIKFLKSNSKKFQKNHFLTNFLMVFFAKNKDNLEIGKLKIEEFIEKTKEFFSSFLNNFFFENKFKNFEIKPQIQLNGFIFFELCSLVSLEIKPKETSSNNKNTMEQELEPKVKNTMDISQKSKKPIKILEEEKKEEAPKIKDLEMRLQKAQYEEESFLLYQKYCKEIHQKNKESKAGYKGFLCEQALEYESLKSGSEELLCGCYHMKYYYQNKLIAVGVVDILLECLSSVYFFYDPDPIYKKLGLGIISSIKEIEWIQNKQLRFKDFKYYYLGFYIQSCQKMVYKGDYGPSELLCPVTYRWVALDENLKILIDKYEKSSQLSPNDNVIIDEMNFKNEEEILKLIDKKIKITLNNRNYAIKDLRSPFNTTFQKIFKVLVRIWGKKVVDYLYFG